MPVSREEAIAELRRRGVAVPGEEGAASPTDAGGLEILGGGYKRNPVGVVYREGPKGGLTQVAGPNATQAGKAVESATGVNAALQSIDRIDSQYARVPMAGLLGEVMDPTDLAVLKQSTTDLLLRMKETPYNLGVLNGPDLMIMQQIVKDPGGVDAMVFRQKIKPLLSNLSSILGEQYRRDSESFGSLGGREQGLPALYRSPRSKFTPEEFGRQGRVSPEAMARPAGQRGPTAQRVPGIPPVARAAWDKAKTEGRFDPSKKRGDPRNPYLAKDEATLARLPKGSFAIGPDGVYGQVE